MDDSQPSPPVFEIPYLRLFPWLRLFRCPGSAADPKRLMLAAAGILLLQLGWSAIDRVFPTAYGITKLVGWRGVLDQRHADEFESFSDFPELSIRMDSPWEGFRQGIWWSRLNRLKEPEWCVVAPFLSAYDPTSTGRAFVHSSLAALWALIVWGLIGGAIARVAVVDLTRRERVGLLEALRFSGRKAGSLLGTPLVPILGSIVVAAPIAVMGLLYRLPGAWGANLAGALAFLPLIGGVLLTLIFVGLVVGWPLMHASVAAEAEDGFDAMSRAYAYVYQRPWHYAGYVAVAAVAGLAGLFFVEFFAGQVVGLAAWALSFGGPAATVGAYYQVSPTIVWAETPVNSPHAFWVSVVALLARGWVYSYFWTAATAIYLLLRRDVDGTPWQTIAYQSRPGPFSEVAAEKPPAAATISTSETDDSPR